MNNNPYLQQIYSVLPRLLGYIDTDNSNPTYGVADRRYWAWKTIDYANASYQGMAHGLALLLVHQLLPDWLTEKVVLSRIEMLFHGTKYITRRDGSLEEAFPYESSFCVTALVAYDLLSCILALKNAHVSIPEKDYLGIIAPLIKHLKNNTETHGFISNHLATAAAALYKWYVINNDPEAKSIADALLQSILNRQDQEGWYVEYAGADPGYQTLALYYLADIHRTISSLSLNLSLTNAVKFLAYFAHPDGSFGGCYGSRNTRFYYPAGFEILANEIPLANSIATSMRKSIEQQTVINLLAIDSENVIPMFNAYCLAASVGDTSPEIITPLPSTHSTQTWRIELKNAGIIIDKGENHYTIISAHKGGVCYHFENQKLKLINYGLVVKDKKNKQYSSQFHSHNNWEISNNTLTIRYPLQPMSKKIFQPSQMMILRFVMLTVGRNKILKRILKKTLVRLLIHKSKKVRDWGVRKINFGITMNISDSLERNYEVVNSGESPFVAIHMASQGYWQQND